MKNLVDQIPQGDKHTIDIISVLTTAGVLFLDLLPDIALILTVVWTLLRIYETETIQRILGRKKDGEGPDTD